MIFLLETSLKALIVGAIIALLLFLPAPKVDTGIAPYASPETTRGPD